MKSILDNDAYKFTMQRAVLESAPDADVEYRFLNRQPEGNVNQAMFDGILHDIEQLSTLEMTPSEHDWIERKMPYLGSDYLEYLKNYRFDPNEVLLDFNTPHGHPLTYNELELSIKGKWHRTILWEVPLMAIISKNYFLHVDKNWKEDGQDKLAHIKGARLHRAGCHWADFGTRRRRNYAAQDRIVSIHKKYNGFIGTSNVHLAHKYDVSPIGTMAHEWIMAASILYSLRHANRYALEKWVEIYKGNLGIALTDTYGTPAFFDDFNKVLARKFDGVRHDSNDPYKFADLVIEHYKSLDIDPLTKTIVFSDGLDTDTAIALQKHYESKIKRSFGIGTHFTNDFGKQSPAMNMVIKLYSIDGHPVVKLSDVAGKATGAADALRVAEWTFGLTSNCLKSIP